jgi:sialate O-acetylesterase
VKIISGLFSHMVLQRNAQGVCAAKIEGHCAGQGLVWASVKGRFAKRRIGKAAKGKFSGLLKGLPAGGPYQVKLWIGAEALVVRDVLVGDVWILGGQSNMQGSGLLSGATSPYSKVRAFYMNDVWGVAKDPIHNMDAAVDQVHADLSGGALPARNKINGTGPGVAFGKAMRRLAQAPQGLIACAHGGTSMAQWNPSLKHKGSASLYGAMLRRFKKNGSAVRGLLWYQGESDTDGNLALGFAATMKKFIRATRKDLHHPSLPFVQVQLARQLAKGHNPPWDLVQEEQRKLQQALPHCATVPAIDLGMDDGIHISGEDCEILGQRLAQAMAVLIRVPGAGKPPITLKKVSLGKDKSNGKVNVTIEFGNVMGHLQSKGKPSGFFLADGQLSDNVVATVLKGNKAIVRANTTLADCSSKKLYYGYGSNPYCNVTDSAGRSLPAFGPLALGKATAHSAYVTKLRTSKILPGAGNLKGLKFPKLKSLGLKTRQFTGVLNFCNRHPELAKHAPVDVLVYYACAFECLEPMQLAAELGYDGPIKVWIDGKQAFSDPKGSNPAMPGDASFKFNAKKGRHEILVALGSNYGRAWGIFLRFLRLDANELPKISG